MSNPAPTPALSDLQADSSSQQNPFAAQPEPQAEQVAEQAPEAESQPEPKKEVDPFASKFAALSKREKELRQREREIESKFAEFEAKMKEYEAKNAKPAEDPLEYYKNPKKLLEKHGWDVDKLLKYEVEGEKLPVEMQMELVKRELESKYEKQLEDLRNEIMNDRKAKEEEKLTQTKQQFMNELTSYVNTDERFELIRANDAVDLIYDVIQAHYEDTGNILDTEQAALHVEQYLEDEVKQVLSKTKKFTQASSSTPAAEKKVSTQTISNAMAQTSTPAASNARLSPEDSKAKAAAMIRWLE